MTHFDLYTFLPYHMNLATNKLVKALFRVYKVYGIDIAQWRILCHLGTTQGMVSAQKIRQLACLDKVPFSRATTALETKGWLYQCMNTQDQRYKDIALTETGQYMYYKITTDVSAWYENLVQQLGQDTVDSLIKHSQKIVDTIE